MEITKNIQSLSDAELCKKLLTLRTNEREALSDLLLHLCELDRRKGYLDLGYGSLFSYLRKALGYSESETYRRIAGARVLKETPDVYSKLRSGKLTLSALNEIAKVRDADAQRALLSSAEGQSSRTIERLVAEHLPATAQTKERVRARKVAPPAATPLLDSQLVDHTPSAPKVVYSMYMEIDEKTMELATEVKALVGGAKNSDLYRMGLEALLEKHSPKKREERRAKRAAKKAAKEMKAASAASEKAPRTDTVTEKPVEAPTKSKKRISRHIPAALRDKITIRDEGRCTFVGPDGRRCNETHYVEVDHVELFSFGGRHTEDNLRLLCRPHNQLMAKRALGKDKMQRMRARR